MWGKILASAAGLLAFALAAFLGHQLINAYGAGQRAAGRLEAKTEELPKILAEREAVSNAKLALRNDIIAAQQSSADELGRILPLILAANDRVSTHAQSDAGRAPCLSADRVRGIESDRAALFSPSSDPADGEARPVRTLAVADESGWQP
jgi:hypothetical protein